MKPASQSVQDDARIKLEANPSPATGLEAFYFNSGDQRLYACYHPAKRKKRKDIAVLFCYPLGRDYFRLHRVYRQFSSRLAKQGIDCLRFDYFGTGDSAGESEEIDLNICQKNVRDALSELQRRAKPKRIYCIGHWLGASLALMAAGESKDVNSLILFDPVLNGDTYLDQQTGNEREERAGSSTDSVSELQGFYYANQTHSQIRQIDARGFQQHSRQRTVLISSNADCYKRDPNELNDFLTQVRGKGQVCQHEHLELDLSTSDSEYDLLRSLPVGELYDCFSKFL